MSRRSKAAIEAAQRVADRMAATTDILTAAITCQQQRADAQAVVDAKTEMLDRLTAGLVHWAGADAAADMLGVTPAAARRAARAWPADRTEETMLLWQGKTPIPPPPIRDTTPTSEVAS